ncbi:MAG TPA: shikimate dehydrogenase [Solirubrobacterales bacterium]|nr:shikimate dehydrogenase [Solirubrobacterales bacterium]
MKRLAVLGHPVAHSRSPAMHNAALAELGLAGEWSYEAIDLAPDELESRLRAMEGEGFVGANVTIPHKEAALRLADTASPVAQAIGAANTLSFEAGGIQADNTDAGGLIDALPGGVRGRRALVLGAGGAARAAIWVLAKESTVVDAVDVWNRTESRAQEIASHLGGAPVGTPKLGNYGLIVNATSVGLHGENPFDELRPLADGQLDSEQVVVDLVYGDRPTGLIEAAKAVGAHAVDGLEILVRQGARSLKIWTERDPPIDVMRNAAREALPG